MSARKPDGTLGTTPGDAYCDDHLFGGLTVVIEDETTMRMWDALALRNPADLEVMAEGLATANETGVTPVEMRDLVARMYNDLQRRYRLEMEGAEEGDPGTKRLLVEALGVWNARKDKPLNPKGKRMLTIKKLTTLCRKHEACKEAIAHLESCKTIEEAAAHPKAPAWAYWLRLNVSDLPDGVKRMAELKACEDPAWAFRLRRNVPNLPDGVKRMAELKACEDPEWAYWLRRNVPDLSNEAKRMAELKACEYPERACELRLNVPDLSNEAKRMAELKACEAPRWAYRLRRNVPDLHPDTTARLAELGIR